MFDMSRHTTLLQAWENVHLPRYTCSTSSPGVPSLNAASRNEIGFCLQAPHAQLRNGKHAGVNNARETCTWQKWGGTSGKYTHLKTMK